MAMVSVPRAEVCELLGVSPDTDDATLQRLLAESSARHQGREEAAVAASAEARLQAEDRQIVAAAINDGRIPVARREFWLDALQRDRGGNRVVLASLASGLPPAEKVAEDSDVERVHARIMASLGIPTGKRQAPRTVAAAQAPSQGVAETPYQSALRRRAEEPSQLYQAAPSQPGDTVRDVLGVPIPGVPAPVRLVRGKDPATWTQQERDDAALWHLGPAFRRGLKPPPGGAGYYRPSPNDVSSYDEASGEWRSKDGWERGVHGIGI